jgi:molybdopterin adenylyltransferase
MGAKGEREDTSGTLIKELVGAPDFEHARYAVVPDERDVIERTLRGWADDDHVDLVLTTGGTGLSDRDVMPEATLAVVDRIAPGLAEAMRAFGMTKTPMAMLSRGVAGVRGRTLIVNLPGSPKGVREGIEVLIPVLGHALGQLTGADRGH